MADVFSSQLVQGPRLAVLEGVRETIYERGGGALQEVRATILHGILYSRCHVLFVGIDHADALLWRAGDGARPCRFLRPSERRDHR